jgi:hypothetical protein
MRCFQSPMAVDICVCRERGTISKWHLGKRQQRGEFRLPRKDNRAVIASSRITQLFWQPQDGFMGHTELGRYSGNCEVTEYVSSRNHYSTSTHLWSSGCNGPLSTGMHAGVPRNGQVQCALVQSAPLQAIWFCNILHEAARARSSDNQSSFTGQGSHSAAQTLASFV